VSWVWIWSPSWSWRRLGDTVVSAVSLGFASASQAVAKTKVVSETETETLMLKFFRFSGPRQLIRNSMGRIDFDRPRQARHSVARRRLSLSVPLGIRPPLYKAPLWFYFLVIFLLLQGGADANFIDSACWQPRIGRIGHRKSRIRATEPLSRWWADHLALVWISVQRVHSQGNKVNKRTHE